MIKRITGTIILFVTLLLTLMSVNAYGFDDSKTHPDITETAIEISKLKEHLGQDFGMADGYKTQLSKTLNSSVVKKSILLWLRGGSTEEDSPLCRAANHFHDPTRKWDESYVTDYPLQTGWCAANEWTPLYSNITWATGYKKAPQDGGARTDETFPNSWGAALDPPAPNNWNNARTYYYRALTSSLESVRQSNFAKTFQAVGQVMHLLQDMAVPAHVRNDFTSHMKFNGEAAVSNVTSPSRWFYNPFEYYVMTHAGIGTDITPTIPSFTRSQLTDLWDTGKYRVSNDPAQTLTDAGLAEYTNANFVSDSTFSTESSPVSPAHYYKYPDSVTSVAKMPIVIKDPANPQENTTRLYYMKTHDGETGYRLAGVGYLEYLAETVSPFNPEESYNYIDKIPPMDEYVHQDYAERLIPRAIGYSAALINYFFRGTIEISLPDEGIYAITGPNGTFNKIKLKAKNTTVNNEAMSGGTLQLVVKYKTATDTNTFHNYSDCVPTSSDFSYIVASYSGGTVTSLTADYTTLTFDLESGMPLNATDVYLQLVYKGQLGNEADAVAVGFKDISEPTPFDVANNKDYTIDAQNPPADYMETVQNVYVAFSSLYLASADKYSAKFAGIPAGSYGRGYVLTDKDFSFSFVRESWTGGVLSVSAYPSIEMQNNGAASCSYPGSRPDDIMNNYQPARGLDSWLYACYRNIGSSGCPLMPTPSTGPVPMEIQFY